MISNREAAIRRLRKRQTNNLPGVKDSRGPVGIFSRGKNVYNGSSKAAHSGGGVQFGRPSKNAIRRRMQGKR